MPQVRWCCLSHEPELYVSVSIWSRGAPIGLPASTAYRAAEVPFSAIAAAAATQVSPASPSSPISSTSGASSTLASSAAAAASAVCNVKWNSWLQFPVPYRDLDHASRFGITVWCVAHGTAVHTMDRTGAANEAADTGSASQSQDGSAPPSPVAAPTHRCSCAAAGHFSPQLGVHSRLFAVGGCSLPIFNKRGSAFHFETAA